MKTIILCSFLWLLSGLAFGQSDKPGGFIGLTLGPSIPLGDFGDKSPDNEKANFAKTGYSDTFINLGHGITRHFGICAGIYYNQYDVDKVNTDLWWMVVGVNIGPMITFPLGEKLFIDLKPKIGIQLSNLVLDTYAAKKDMGSALGVDLRFSMRYNLFRNWCLLMDAGYIDANEKFLYDRTERIQALSAGVGIGYRLK